MTQPRTCQSIYLSIAWSCAFYPFGV